MGRGKITPLSKRFIKNSPNTGLNELIDNPNCTLFGGMCDQPFTAFYVWEKFFTTHCSNMKRFIEFGCDQGNTSVYFALWCANLGATYTGFDKRKPELYANSPVKRLVGLKKKMVLGNGYQRKNYIKELVQDKGMTVLFTDCIDKPWEFSTFAPMMKPGDVLVVHDWDRAIKDEWVPKAMARLQPYELLYEEERLQLNTLTRFFKKGKP